MLITCDALLPGSFRSPTRIASTGQTVTQAGSSPTSSRCAHRLHFSAEWSSGLMKIASYGQAAMHALHPMQISLSKSTIPSSRRYMAWVGHAATHGASSHWLHLVTWNARRTSGNSPTSTDFTKVRVTPTGTSFSLLHAVVHAWHPMHLLWSSSFTHRGPCCGVRGAPGSCMLLMVRRASRPTSVPLRLTPAQSTCGYVAFNLAVNTARMPRWCQFCLPC